MPLPTSDPLSMLHTWLVEQQPLVRALATPMVDQMKTAFSHLQGAMDERDAIITNLQGAMNERDGTITHLQGAILALQEKNLGEHIQHFQQVMDKYNTGQNLISDLTDGLTSSQTVIDELTSKLQTATDRIDVMERNIFGPRSERRKGTKKKIPDPTREAKKRFRKSLTDAEKKARRKAAEEKRQAALDALRTVTHTVKLPEGFNDGESMAPETAVVYEWHPGELVRVRIEQERRMMPSGCVLTAPPVEEVAEGGRYGPRMYAKIAVDKCLNVMPLRRQERIFKRMGMPMAVSTICTLFHRAADLITPIYQALQAHVATAPHVSGDETPLPVLADGAYTHKSWMWVFVAPDAVLFVHSPSRGKGVPLRILGKTKGTLTVDGYTAYNCVTGECGRKRGGCWCHARRGLYDALEHDKTFIQPLLEDMGELFYMEELASEKGITGTLEHLALRKAKSKPVVQRIFAVLEAYDLAAKDGRSSITKAVRYILNQRKALQLFLEDAAVPLHNNYSERTLRIIALLRKNALFAGSDDAAQRFAQTLSLLATCELHGINPEDWMADVLLAINERGLIASDLLPWNWKETRGQSYQAYFDTG